MRACQSVPIFPRMRPPLLQGGSLQACPRPPSPLQLLPPSAITRPDPWKVFKATLSVSLHLRALRLEVPVRPLLPDQIDLHVILHTETRFELTLMELRAEALGGPLIATIY